MWYKHNKFIINVKQNWLFYILDNGDIKTNVNFLTGLFDMNGHVWYKKATDLLTIDNLRFVFENLGVFKLAKFLLTYLIRKSGLVIN